MQKPKLAMYWAASCGGCEISIVNLHEGILDIDRNFDFMFCPCLLDTKKRDIEALPDQAIAATLFNGAIRTEENEEMAHLLRKKSRLLIAYGACACAGGIPALSNLHTRERHFETVYRSGPTLDNPAGVVPQEETKVPEGVLRLPRFFDRVRSLEQTVEVDYSVPGCPPETEQVWTVVEALMSGRDLPARGSVLGGGDSTVCDECERKRTDKKIERLHRIWEIVPDREHCLLEQGLMCMGVATRNGCGAKCPSVSMPCIGCYGAPEGVYDQGAKMASTLGAILDIASIQGLRDEQAIYARVDEQLRAVADLAGTACKFGLAGEPRRR